MNEELKVMLADGEKVYSEFEDVFDVLWRRRNKNSELFDLWTYGENVSIAFITLLNAVREYLDKYEEV